MKEQDKPIEKDKVKQNTSVYLSGLPSDITVDELRDSFSKYGIIAQDLLTNKYKVKLYNDEKGHFTGSALVTYLRPESVTLAVSMADGLVVKNSTIKVEEAVFNKNNNVTKRAISEEEQKIINKRLKIMKQRASNWDENNEKQNMKWVRSVVLKRVFTLKELEEDSHAKEDIQLDIEDGCSDIGKVDKVVLFDQEPEGIVLVRFVSAQDADACIDQMNGRFFGGQKLIATKYNGEDFQRTENAEKHKHKEDKDTTRLDEYIKTVQDE